mgnify:CR=1 FL=1
MTDLTESTPPEQPRPSTSAAAADDAQVYYDQETEVRFLIDALRRLRNKHAIDVGAERGSFVGALLDAGADSVYAFEPFPANVAALRERFEGHQAVQIFDLALGARDETTLLHVVEDKTHHIGDAYHTLVAFDETPTLRIVDHLSIQCRTLDGLVAEGRLPARVGILKIDTERSDLDVLRGIGRLHADVVMLEFWDTLPETVGASPYQVADVVTVMAERGYSTYVLFKRHDQFETIQLNDSTTRPGDWGNVLFVHDTILPVLAELVYASAARSQTQLVDRAVYFAGEAEKRLELLTREAGAGAEARAAHTLMAADLQEKEYVIAELTATAEERLLALQQASSAAEAVRAEHARMSQALATMTATAEERLQLVTQLDAHATRLRESCEQLSQELDERERVITELSATADERLQLVEHAAADRSSARDRECELEAALKERQRVVEELASVADERLGLIADANEAAEQRLHTIEALNADALLAREGTDRLHDELARRDQLIAELTRSADERLDLATRATAEAAEAHAALATLTAALEQKEATIMELTATAADRLRLLDAATSDGANAHAEAESLRLALAEQAAVIADLKDTADERLQIIDRLTAEAARTEQA